MLSIVRRPFAADRFLVARVGVVAAMFVAGCGGGRDFGERITVQKSSYFQMTGPLATGRSMRIPADQPFNVTQAQRSSEGAADADSSAGADGTASCSARATEGGYAVAEFQVGYVLAYDASESYQARITFDVGYDCSVVRGQTDRDIQPLGLKAYVMDSDRRVLGMVHLTDVDPDRLPARWSGSQSPSFDVAFVPGAAYHIIVAGRVEAAGTDGGGTSASLRLKSFAIHINPASG